MKQTTARLILALFVLSLASCTSEKRVYTRGYHISWLHPKPLKQQNVTAAIPCSFIMTENSAEDSSKNQTNNFEADLSNQLSQPSHIAEEFEIVSDTIVPNTKEDDYFGQKNYPSEQSKTNFKKNNIFRQKDIIQIKKDTKSMFIIAFFSLLISSFSIFLISETSNIGSVNGFKSLIALILLAIFSFGLFIITLPVGIFLLFKLLYLKITKKGISIDSPMASS